MVAPIPQQWNISILKTLSKPHPSFPEARYQNSPKIININMQLHLDVRKCVKKENVHDSLFIFVV